jgi:hypothetical protein
VTQDVENRGEALRIAEMRNRRSAGCSAYCRRSAKCLCQFQPNWPSDPGY